MKKYFCLLFILFAFKASAQTLKDCATCATKALKAEQINSLSIDELRFLTNDLMARKGYQFKSGSINSYFSDQPWYKPKVNNKIVYNTVEKQNIKVLQQRTNALEAQRKSLIDAVKNFKATVLANDQQALKSKYGYVAKKDQVKYLKESLKKINLDDINWFKTSGLHSVDVDNGDVVLNHEIRISQNTVSVKYGNRGGSKIGGNLYPSQYHIEFSLSWEFSWKNGKLTFVKVIDVG